MRKQLAVAFGLLVVATPALATKARLEALGEDNFGSYYINDNRNYFLNPARINNHKDLITYEFGKSGADNTSTIDSAATPKAEGGFTKGIGNLVYGAHFGNSTPSVGLVRGVAGLGEVQPLDLFVGGDAGMKWGANVTYENYRSGTAGNTNRLDSTALRVRGGVMMGEMEFFAHVSLANKANNYQGKSVDGDIGFLLGASTMVQQYRLFADLTKFGADYTNPAGVAGKNDLDYTRIRLGAGRQDRLNDRATLFTKVMLTRTALKDDGGVANAGLMPEQLNGPGKSTIYNVPVVAGLEYAATSWLDLRASVTHNVLSRADIDPKGGKKGSSRTDANTGVNAGASLKFGEFSIDGLISTNASGDGTTMANNGSTDQGNGTLRTDNLMSRVSMIYRF
jgi:hypothetical protein